MIFPSPSSDLGKKLDTTKKEHDLDMKMIWLFIFQTTPNQFNLWVQDSFMKIWLHMFQLSFKVLSANISTELFIWKINVLISILVRIVENVIMHQKNVPREASLQD